MRRPRLYIPVPLASGQAVALDDAAFGHAIQVLRLRTGAPLIVFNGNGGEFNAIVEHVSRRHASVRIGRFHACDVESPLPVRLLQGICRGDRMDYTMQKAVELGVTEIVPLLCQRTPPPRDQQRLSSRLTHWQRVIESACEQCGRTTLPRLTSIRLVVDALSEPLPDATRLVLDPTSANGLSGINTLAPRVIELLVGPEGGLNDDELERTCSAGFVPVRLGPRILRTETAGLAALAAVQTLWGDLG